MEYGPWERTARGRRRQEVPLSFAECGIVHRFETRSYPELVRELEAGIARCSTWMHDGH